MSSRKIIDIANSLDFVRDYNVSGISGNNARISTSDNGQLYLYSEQASTNSTTATVVLYNGGLSISNTNNSTSYTSGGALTIRGGSAIEKNLYIGESLYVATNISSSTLNVSGLTSGNINFTGNLYQNGSLYISSQWKTGTGGNLSYTDGNVGINTTAPGYTLDVNGTTRSVNIMSTNVTTNTINATGITAGNINFTGNLYQNGSVYISSQWTTGIGGNLTYIDGNVGIGTTSPTNTLTINGSLSVSGSPDISSIVASRNGNVVSIKNALATGNSSIEFQSTSGSAKMYIGFANASSSITNFIGASYILSENATSIKIAAGNKTAVPVIINASDNSVSITTTTDASDIYSGSLKVSGGAGIANSLYVGDDAHINRDLYVNGAINGAAASSSTFAYLTLTATDDAMNLSTGSLITFGGITIQSTADATTVCNGGSFLTDGGASIGKTLYVGQKIITDLVSASNLQTDNVTIGSLLATNVNLGIFSMFSGSFIPTNSNVSPSNVTGLMFDNTYIRSFTVTLSANITATTSLYETFVLEGVQLDSGWDLYVSSYGDSTDITFSITNSGNIQYTTPNYPGFINAIFRFQVSQINKTGSYSYPGIGVTQATLIANTLQLLNTQDSVSGVNNGSLYVMGGCTISKTMFSNNITTGDLRASYATLGNLVINSNLTVAGTITTLNITTTNLVDTNISCGTLRSSDIIATNFSTGDIIATNSTITNVVATTETVGTSRITTSLVALGNSNTLGSIYTKDGNVGIGTTSPITKLHVLNTGSVQFLLQNTLQDTTSTASSTKIYSHSDGKTYFQTSGDIILGSAIDSANLRNMYLTTGGNVGIGTTVPVAPLHVIGTTSATSTTVGGIFMGTFTDNNTFIQLNSTTGSYIDFSGNNNDYLGRILYTNSINALDFYTNSGTVARMDSTGSLTITGDFAAFTSISDARLKTNVVSINGESSLDIINTLNPVTFDWRDDIFNESARGQSDVGFIAQEVESVIPYAVSSYSEVNSGEIYKRMKHERIIPYLTSAIQTLDTERIKQNIEIQRLTNIIEHLNNRLSNIESYSML